RPPHSPPQCAPGATDSLARSRVRRPETRPHPLPDAKIDGEEVSRRTPLATPKLSHFPYLKKGWPGNTKAISLPVSQKGVATGRVGHNRQQHSPGTAAPRVSEFLRHP